MVTAKRRLALIAASACLMAGCSRAGKVASAPSVEKTPQATVTETLPLLDEQGDVPQTGTHTLGEGKYSGRSWCNDDGKIEELGREGETAYFIQIHAEPFVPAHHKIKYAHGKVESVDGRAPIGTDYGMPRHEITEFLLNLNGQDVQFPKRFWADCYEAFSLKQNNVVSVYPGKNKDEIDVIIGGGDGAGAYLAYWTLRKNGRHVRRVTFDEATVYELPGYFDGVDIRDPRRWKSASLLK